MAIDTIPYRDADNLVHAQKAFYPVRIPVSHWQLRHYISSPEPDLLYYASSHDIYCLNTTTEKRKLVATLPFEARCTAAGHGWVCVGGEDEGHFAAIKLDGGSRTSLDVDSALPLEPWRSNTYSSVESGRRAASVKVERIGEEIVNSISIHRIQDEEAHLDDIVAVLTNNDKTVRVYSLPQGVETTVLDLPFAMNHATISPDGQTLVAVGDFNQAYFFQRELSVPPPQIPKPHNRLTSSSCEWTLMSVVGLHAAETTSGYFTTAWSPNGHLVAVGSEGGYVTVFDMEMLMSSEVDDEDAIVAVVPGSRPELSSFPGAVRSMMFAPDPWDLLIWAEDQGRICIGDLRTGLKTKQVVNLEPKDAGLEKLVYEEAPGDGLPAANIPAPSRDIHDLEQEFLRRYGQAAPDNATAVNFATEYIEARRRQRQQRQDMASLRSVANSAGVSALEDDPQGLTAREQQILESLRTTRQREEARAHGSGNSAAGVTYTSPELFHAESRSATPYTRDLSGSARPISEILNSVPDSFPELSRSSGTNTTSTASDQPPMLPSLDEIQDVVSGRQRSSGSWLSRTIEGSRLPRRRASVVLPPSYAGAMPPSTSHAAAGTPRGHRAPGQALSSTHPHPGDEENPWRTIEEHMTLARGPLFEGAAQATASSPLPPPLAPSSFRPSEQELEVELAAERARARSLARQRERVRGMRTTAAAEATGANATTASTTPLTTEQQVRRLAGFPEGYEMLMRRGQVRGMGMGFTGAGSREVGVRTAGLAVSGDGRRLWAACEEGIFEVEINVKGRLFWPSVEVR
ncbi:hypothetical protein LTR78_008053 [Recurvomyces mirabilis]|uniref:DUF2415 domain-containing protein n=1 Tax=Recurvomyces mirabilis TaxID=574656 RepID=A0AAE0TV17_9PEZI|nr:hypothetical protein LTR78_008053 [Recurvomyces mirabilis]KAK5150781.1 hypothetical protein LTS14_009844 [Recurvomyces mirabilis]